jgi:biopolymer transport protein ExbB/TolQ
MEWLMQSLGENWQPIIVTIAVIVAAAKAAWNERQKRLTVQHGKENAAKQIAINEQAMKQALEGLQEINEAKDAKLQEAEQSIDAMKNALEEKKHQTAVDLKSNHSELADRLAKITGAKRVK